MLLLPIVEKRVSLRVMASLLAGAGDNGISAPIAVMA